VTTSFSNSQLPIYQ